MNILEKAESLVQGAQEMKSQIQLFGDEQKEIGRSEGYSSGYAQGKNDGYDQGVNDAQAGNGGDPLIYTLDDLNQYGAEQAGYDYIKSQDSFWSDAQVVE